MAQFNHIKAVFTNNVQFKFVCLCSKPQFKIAKQMASVIQDQLQLNRKIQANTSSDRLLRHDKACKCTFIFVTENLSQTVLFKLVVSCG